MSRAKRDSLIIPSAYCPVHGENPGRTRCKVCGIDPLFPKPSPSNFQAPLAVAGLPRAFTGDEVFYSQQVVGQKSADVIHQKIFAGIDPTTPYYREVASCD